MDPRRTLRSQTVAAGPLIPQQSTSQRTAAPPPIGQNKPKAAKKAAPKRRVVQASSTAPIVPVNYTPGTFIAAEYELGQGGSSLAYVPPSQHPQHTEQGHIDPEATNFSFQALHDLNSQNAEDEEYYDDPDADGEVDDAEAGNDDNPPATANYENTNINTNYHQPGVSINNNNSSYNRNQSNYSNNYNDYNSASYFDLSYSNNGAAGANQINLDDPSSSDPTQNLLPPLPSSLWQTHSYQNTHDQHQPSTYQSISNPSSSVTHAPSVPMQRSTSLSEVQRRLRGDIIQHVGRNQNTLGSHQARQSGRSLPNPHILADSSGGGSSVAGSTNPFQLPHSPLSSSGSTGPIRTAKSKTKVRRTTLELQSSSAFLSQSSGRPVFSTSDKYIINLASTLYIRDLCISVPWPDGDVKLVMMTECLSQANVRALADGKATTTVESGGYVLQKRIGNHGSNFRGGHIKAWLEAHMTECWEINPPIALADTMSSTAIVEYKKSKIAALLLSDSFAHNGFWTVPNPKDPNQPGFQIPYWFNRKGLHIAVEGIFYDVTEDRFATARDSPNSFLPLFPLPALALTLGIAKHVLISSPNGVIQSVDMDNSTRGFVHTFLQAAELQMAKPLYKVPIERELRKMADRGRQRLGIVLSNNVSNVSTSSIELNYSIEDVFGDGPVVWDDVAMEVNQY